MAGMGIDAKNAGPMPFDDLKTFVDVEHVGKHYVDDIHRTATKAASLNAQIDKVSRNLIR